MENQKPTIEFSQSGIKVRSFYTQNSDFFKTAEGIADFFLKRFPQTISTHIGLFHGWEICNEDICGRVHQIPTKVPSIRKQEAESVGSEMNALAETGIIERFYGKPKHIIPWFTVAKKEQASRRVVLDFRAINTLTDDSPAILSQETRFWMKSQDTNGTQKWTYEVGTLRWVSAQRLGRTSCCRGKATCGHLLDCQWDTKIQVPSSQMQLAKRCPK